VAEGKEVLIPTEEIAREGDGLFIFEETSFQIQGGREGGKILLVLETVLRGERRIGRA